jgi:hypothetical protein
MSSISVIIELILKFLNFTLSPEVFSTTNLTMSKILSSSKSDRRAKIKKKSKKVHFGIEVSG